MFSGTLILHNLPNREKNKSIEYIEIINPNIDNFKVKILELFNSNNWPITIAKFFKANSNKLFSFDEIENAEFIFTTVNVFWFANI